ncbi:DUF4221 family protein [Marivirga sp.]|uniref:DUF4221 family protein n=1 Tax=Marivirga sp. TaxID=2018662 RepID=UPI0025F0319C|nr:DUF4221 family protein [Marivirga sp.]
MKISELLLINVIFIISIACNNQNTENECNHKTFEEFSPIIIDSLKIKISNTTSDQNISSQIKVINGTQYLFRFNDYQSNTNPASIEIYDLNHQRFIKRVDLPLEGPNSYEGAINFYVHNFDSIFLHNEANPLTFYLTDTSANNINKWYAKDRFKAAGWMTSAQPFYDPKEKQIWYYNISPRYFYPDDKEFFEIPYLSYFKLSDKTIGSVDDLKYPDQYVTEFKNRNWFPWFQKPAYDYIDNKIYISFPLSPQINIIENNSISQICLGTDLLDLPESVPIDINDFPSNQQFYMQSGRYFGIMKDNFRNILIRLVKFSQEKRNLDGLLNKHYNAQFALIIYRDNKPLDIIRLPKDTYNPHLIIPSRKGLLISTDNPFNENNDENFLNFNLISLDKFSK